jgi:SRSO17 transposase
LYLPQSWAEDRERCRAAGIPENAEFTTKPRQAQAMISRAIAAGVRFSWFTADEVYGQAKMAAGVAGRPGRVLRDDHPAQRHLHHGQGRAAG